MKYFRFDAGDSVVAWTITDSAFTPLDRFGSTNYWSTESRQVHVPLLDTDRDLTRRSQLPDAIGVGIELVVSRKLRQLFVESTIDPNVEFLQVDIVNRRRSLLATDYYLLMSQEWHNVLDPDKSDAEILDNGMALEVGNWVMDQRCIPPYDLWYANAHSWVVSERFRRSLRFKITKNLAFFPTRVSYTAEQ